MTRPQQSSFLFSFFIVFLCGGVSGQGEVNYSIRLEGSVSDKEGRVEVFSKGSWGTICDDMWDNTDAAVVCRQLGFLGLAMAKTDAFFGQGSGDIVFDDVQCVGSETNIGQCPASPVGSHNCGHGEDAGVICSELGKVEYSIRLSKGSSNREGRVEVFYEGAWGTICDDGWDDLDATVVCNQLGFFGTSTARGAAYFGFGSGDIVLDNVACAGSETNLGQCSASTDHNCAHSEDAGVICSIGETATGLFAVRLEGGSSHLEGRVEVFYQGSWGTVCDDMWDTNDAVVVCRQLGFLGLAIAKESGHFGAGSGDIILDNVDCDGTELTLRQCDADISGHNCAHSEDAGVICSESGAIGDYTIRLVGGFTDHEGRVEVFLNGAWGTVCDDEWDINDATVVCRQLGFSLSMHAKVSAYFGQGTGKIYLDNVDCSGSESDLQGCQASTEHNCSHREDAGVICSDEDGNTSKPGDIRLIGGSTRNVGTVEVYYNSLWSTICDDEWDRYAADVACYQLGYKRAEAYRTSAYYGSGNGPIAMTEVSCYGTEVKITDCSHLPSPSNCFHSEDAGVDCSIPDVGDIRLVDGNSQLEGRLEFFTTDGWGTVCDIGWDEQNAEVVCRELGFYGVGSANYDGSFGTSSGPIVLSSSVLCSGTEERLADCETASSLMGSFCSHDKDVAVQCRPVMSGGAIAGMVFGIILGVLLLCVCCWCRCLKSSPNEEATTTVTATAPVSNGERTAGGYTPVAQDPSEVTHPPAAYYSHTQNTVDLNPTGGHVKPPPPTYHEVISQPSAYPVTVPEAGKYMEAYPVGPTAPPQYLSQGYHAPSQDAAACPLPSQAQMPYPPAVYQYRPPSDIQETDATQLAPSGVSAPPFPTTQPTPSAPTNV